MALEFIGWESLLKFIPLLLALVYDMYDIPKCNQSTHFLLSTNILKK